MYMRLAFALAIVLATTALAIPATAFAQGTITPNYKDADLSQIIEAVSAVTGKNFIVDRAQARDLSRLPFYENAFYRTPFDLQVHGFVAIPSGMDQDPPRRAPGARE
jgi:general secretion pathway protein D